MLSISVDEGGACSGAEGERVEQSSQDNPVDDLVVNQGSRVVECNSARSNHQGNATLQTRYPLVESLSGSSSSSGNSLDSRPQLSLGKEVVGFSLASKAHVSLEDQTRERAHYFVEEPDSPRNIVVIKDSGPFEDTLSRPLRFGHLAGVFPTLGLSGSGKFVDEGLTNAFSKSLSLKRKNDYLLDSDEEDGGKRVKRITSGEIGVSELDKGESVLGRKRFSPTLSRARGRRGRGSRGRSAGRGLGRKGDLPTESCNDELFEVSMGDAYSGDQFGGDSVGSKEVSTVSMEVSTSDEGSNRALVAGPKQPRVQW